MDAFEVLVYFVIKCIYYSKVSFFTDRKSLYLGSV